MMVELERSYISTNDNMPHIVADREDANRILNSLFYINETEQKRNPNDQTLERY